MLIAASAMRDRNMLLRNIRARRECEGRIVERRESERRESERRETEGRKRERIIANTSSRLKTGSQGTMRQLK